MNIFFALKNLSAINYVNSNGLVTPFGSERSGTPVPQAVVHDSGVVAMSNRSKEDIDDLDSASPDLDMDLTSRGDEPTDCRSVTSRERLRQKMQADIDAFLNGGGKIQLVERGLTAERLNQQSGEL